MKKHLLRDYIKKCIKKLLAPIIREVILEREKEIIDTTHRVVSR